MTTHTTTLQARLIARRDGPTTRTAARGTQTCRFEDLRRARPDGLSAQGTCSPWLLDTLPSPHHTHPLPHTLTPSPYRYPERWIFFRLGFSALNCVRLSSDRGGLSAT
jgi:hypothetical protein